MQAQGQPLQQHGAADQTSLSLPELIVGGGPHSRLKPGPFTWHQHPTEATVRQLVQRLDSHRTDPKPRDPVPWPQRVLHRVATESRFGESAVRTVLPPQTAEAI